MTPAGSWPSTIGYSHGVPPTPPAEYECRSDPQMPTASTRTWTSPGPGAAIVSSRRQNVRYAMSSATRISLVYAENYPGSGGLAAFRFGGAHGPDAAAHRYPVEGFGAGGGGPARRSAADPRGNGRATIA